LSLECKPAVGAEEAVVSDPNEDSENVVALKIWDPGSYSQIVKYHFSEKVPKGNDRALSSVPKFQKKYQISEIVAD
jgi:hypothetical protein